MSSLGRPNTNKLIEELQNRINILDDEVGNEKQYDPPSNPTGIFLRIDDIENNLGTPSQVEIEAGGDIIQFQANATGLNLDVETLRTDTNKLLQQVGDDDKDPKTGIFLRLYDIENADTIIPHYDYEALYYILLDKSYEITDDTFSNIKIDNSQNSNLNDVLVNILTDVEILKQNNSLTRSMIGQAGFGAGATVIKAPILTDIKFNTRDLTSLGFDLTSLPTFDGLGGSISQEYVNQKAIEIADFIYGLIPGGGDDGFDFLGLQMSREEFILQILKAQDPIEFLQGQVMSRVVVGIQGDLFVKDGSVPKGPLELGASWLNVNEIAKQAKDLHEKNIQIYNVKSNDPIEKTSDGNIYLNYDANHFKKNATTFKLELKYPILAIEDHFFLDSSKSLNLRYWANHLKMHIEGNNEHLAIRIKPNSGISDDNTGIFINKYNNHFDIDTTGTDINKLKIKLKPNNGLSSDTDGILLNKYNNHFQIDTVGTDINKLKIKLKDNKGLASDTYGLFINYYADHFRSGAIETGEEIAPEASGKLRLKIDDDFYKKCSDECKLLYKKSHFRENKYIYIIKEVLKEVMLDD